MIHYQYKNSEILFAGINPHPGSFDRGIPFSNNKLFWYLLSRAGLIKEKIEDLKDGSKLRYIYKSKAFVMHAPLRGKAEVRIHELKKAVKASRD